MLVKVGNETFNFDLVTRTTYSPEGNILEIFFVNSEEPWVLDGEKGKKLWEYLCVKSTVIV